MDKYRELIAKWRDKAIRWSLAGPTANGQTVDALRYCADELEQVLAGPTPLTDLLPTPESAKNASLLPYKGLAKGATQMTDIKLGDRVRFTGGKEEDIYHLGNEVGTVVELYPLVTVSCPDGENRVLGSISDKWPLHLEVIGQRGRAKR